jgi:hypothetical protein
MRMTRAVLLVLLVIGLCGCKSASREKEAAAIFTKANGVWAATGELSKEWTTEYVAAFAPEDRAQFPANRAALRTSADKIVKILDEEIRLGNEAIPQYEQAIALMSNEQHVKGMNLLISSLRKGLEANEFVKSQMRLVSDESILDAKTFEERFLGLGAQFGKARGESQRQFDEGRRILGI